MKAHAGSVKVADNPGGGAVFTLAFPVLKPGGCGIPRPSTFVAADKLPDI